ncbi:MAG: hypothetical protein IJ113_09140 [Eggerthellaceae bacterium]|nr:hypothetical protein [Eggerthellaceae bacterium]
MKVLGIKQALARVGATSIMASLYLCLLLGLSACGGQAAATSSAVTDASASAETSIVEVEASASEDASAETSASASDTSAIDATTSAQDSSAATSAAASIKGAAPTEADITINETIEDSGDGTHAIEADGESASYSNVAVNKTGDAAGNDEADFYGENAAIFATNGATLDLSEMVIKTNGTHANAVFSYGEGTTVNISDSVIETTGNTSGGLMTTGGGTMNASNLNIHTTGNSSAAIRSDRGGGTVNVDGGSYVTDGTGSPVIYSTADITVSNATMESTASQGVVVEGKNSVTLNNVDLVASNVTKNSDKSDWYQAVMIYQSMSGDAAVGTSSFAMNGGTLTNQNGDVFFVNNTVTTISLDGAQITNNGDGVFLRAAAAGWGNEGSNGGQVTLNATNQTIDGDMVVDEVSNLNLYLSDGSTFTGAINADGQAGEVYVDLSDGSTWTLTGDSYITSLTCDADSINLNGYTLYVDGKAYSEGSASTGEAIEATVSSGGGMGGAPDGQGGPGGTPPDGAPGDGGTPPDGAPGDGGTPSEPPSGSGPSGGTPPEKPSN